ncbi:MAG: DEAD/DEAH box helicase [Crocinitomicaceae bacterium]|nr:DEAD/DEAH box helicase [Crocinitomicaceae bacterium]
MDNDKTLLQHLSKFLEDNASFVVLNRAAIYTPELIEENESVFKFHVHGSLDEPYLTNIWWNAQFRIYSSCTCPYSGEGICKHQVAAIHLMMKELKSRKINALKSKVSELEKHSNRFTEIPVENGVIDLAALSRMKFESSHFYYLPTKITEVDNDSIKGHFEDFRKNYEQELKYNEATDELLLSCNCNARKNCNHKLQFINLFLDRFPNDYFSPNFLPDFKRKIEQENNFPPSLKFDDVLMLKFSPKGLEVEQKIKNLTIAEKGPLQLFTEEKSSFHLPPSSEKAENYGIGLCLESHQKKIRNIYPFTGKYNKAKTELSTKFSQVYDHTLTETLSELKETTQKQYLLEAVQLAHYYMQYIQDETPENIRQLWEKFNNALSLWQQFPIFLYNSKKTFVRKHVTPILIQPNNFQPILKVTETDKFFQLDIKIKYDHQSYLLQSNLLTLTPIGIIHKEQLQSFASPEQAQLIMKLYDKGQINVIKTDLKTFRENVLKPFSKHVEIDFPGLKAIQKKNALENFEKHIYLSDEEGEYVVLRAVVQYGEHQISPDSQEKIWDEEEVLSYAERNHKEEQAFIAFMQNLHPDFTSKTDFFYLTGEQALQGLWLMDAIEKMKENDIKIFGLNNLSNIRYNLNKPSFSMNLSSGTDWFDMNIDISFGDQKVDLKQLQKAIVNQQNFVELGDGTLGLLPQDWIEKYKKYFKLGQVKKDKIEISNYQFNIIDELYEELTNTPKFLVELHEKKKRLLNLSELTDVPKPRGLKAKLRTYQHEGLNWLVFLHENKLGGCLADDMGLGKTLQTIAFLLHLKNNTTKKERLPHLIIAPTSLMFNWQAEIEKFAPSMKMLAYIGPNREELRPLFSEQDIILSTYGSLIKDVHFHKNNNYSYVVLDESQAIKNPQSQRFKAVRLLQCENRLVLTGTPIENNTFDLYSQFNFINPGIFGSIKHFKATFSDAIDKDQDTYTSQLLARMIHPFILRRTKAQVATELPPKTESVIYCEMGSEQRKVYEDFKLYFRQKLLEQIEEEGENKSQMYILQGLTKLRQICNSTALADKNKDYGNYSAKLDELTRHLKEKVHNHKVLVFSQFVGMLQLVKTRLEKEGILFEYLDGQTSNREEKVNNFQTNSDIRVFLISLKAGGTGLNLTEADYVYLIDPWWNPAVESQAIDRSYRIGQDKKVMAYRMICKDTIEEKIVKLQDKKKTVASEVIQVDQDKKTFKKEDVELFFG